MFNHHQAVIITRPHLAAVRLSAALAEIGIPESIHVISPLHDIRELGEPCDLGGYAAIVFTSENGVRAFTQMNDSGSLPAYCVGHRTAATAFQHGFDAKVAANTSASLVQLIANDEFEGPVLYARGRMVSRDIAALLRDSGIKVDEQIVYEQVPRELSDQAKEALISQRCIAPLFSERTAAHFADSVKFIPDLGHIAVCVSRTVAERFYPAWEKRVLKPADINFVAESVKDALLAA